MRYWGLFGLFYFVLICHTWGQQLPQYSQYMMNYYLINPACTGIEDYVDIRTGYRNQWTNYPGAPQTYYVTATMALNKPDRTSTGPTPFISKNIRRPLPLTKEFDGVPNVPGHHGIGIGFWSDNIGNYSQYSLTASYAYHIPLTGRMKLSVGASGGVTENVFNFDNITVKNPVDNAISTGKLTALSPQLNLGAWLYSQRFYVGISANQVLFKNFNYKNTDLALDNHTWLGTVNPHYFITAGIRRILGAEDQWTLVPSVLLKKVYQAPLSYDINLKAMYKNRVWGGISYRHQESVIGMLGVNVSGFMNISYAYDVLGINLANQAHASHEITLGLLFNNRNRIICPQILW